MAGETSPLDPSRPPRLIRLGVVLASLAAALLLGELLLRSLVDVHSFRIWTPGLETVFRPSPDRLSGVEGDSLFRINSRGLRGDEIEPEDGYRILAIGGSGTECLYLDQAEAWPAILQARLRDGCSAPRAWVGNGGMSGRNIRDHVVQLRHLLPQFEELDAVLLMCGVNDLTLRLAQDEHYLPAFLDREEAERELLPRAFEVLPLSLSTGAPWWKRTALWRLADLTRSRFFGPARVQDEAGAIYTEWREHRAGASRRIDTLPPLDEALAEQRRHLESIAAICRAHDLRLLLVTHPSLWSEGLPPSIEARFWLGGIGDFQREPGAAYYRSGALAEGMARYNRVLEDLAEQWGLECLDVAGELGRDPTCFYDAVHLNEAGARRAGEYLARQLLTSAPFR
jgi:hypothetical protein